MNRIIQAFTIALLLMPSITYADKGKGLKLWYKQPATIWHAEGLPIGNGRIGAMMMGGIKADSVQFNEISLWSGDNNWDGGYDTGDHGFGSYRNFGQFVVEFNDGGSVKDYERSLNIATGIQTTSYEINGVKMQREAFASYPDQSLVFRYTAGKNGTLTGKISLSSAQGAKSIGQDQ